MRTQDHHRGSHARSAAMIATSAAVMHGPMRLDARAPDHALSGWARMRLALCTGAVMAVAMLAFMLGPYAERAPCSRARPSPSGRPSTSSARRTRWATPRG